MIIDDVNICRQTLLLLINAHFGATIWKKDRRLRWQWLTRRCRWQENRTGPTAKARQAVFRLDKVKVPLACISSSILCYRLVGNGSRRRISSSGSHQRPHQRRLARKVEPRDQVARTSRAFHSSQLRALSRYDFLPTTVVQTTRHRSRRARLRAAQELGPNGLQEHRPHRHGHDRHQQPQQTVFVSAEGCGKVQGEGGAGPGLYYLTARASILWSLGSMGSLDNQSRTCLAHRC